MSLNRKERRALRSIEGHLAAEDPALADLLRNCKTARLDRRVRKLRRWVVAASLIVTVFGAVLISGGLVIGGLLTLMILPALRRLAMAFDRWQ